MSDRKSQFELKLWNSGGWDTITKVQPTEQKTNLVLLPGLLCDETVWAVQVAELSHQVTCFCAAYGDLASFKDMSEAVLREAPQNFALAGHSMGGRVALEIYRRAPERVTGIALMNTGAGARPAGPEGEEEERRRRELLQLARSEGMRAMAMKWLPPMMHPTRMSDHDLVEAIVGMFERKTPEIYEGQMNALLARPDAIPVLSAISCPALLLSGQEDGWSPPIRHQEMAARIPGSRVAVISNCGHMSTMEQPREVTREMHRWLKSVFQL